MGKENAGTEYEFGPGPMGISLRAVGGLSIISKADPKGLVALKGVRVGSVITAVNGKAVANRQEAITAIKASSRPLRLTLLPPEAGGGAALERSSAMVQRLKIVIKNKGETSWGLALEHGPRYLSIHGFDGAIARHNEEKSALGADSTEMIAIGDKIHGVNDAFDDTREMVRQIKESKQQITLHIQ